jgi:hypothetical protein
MTNFAQSGKWDLQRPRDQKDSQGKQINYPEFVDAATVAIGIYCEPLVSRDKNRSSTRELMPS